VEDGVIWTKSIKRRRGETTSFRSGGTSGPRVSETSKVSSVCVQELTTPLKGTGEGYNVSPDERMEALTPSCSETGEDRGFSVIAKDWIKTQKQHPSAKSPFHEAVRGILLKGSSWSQGRGPSPKRRELREGKAGSRLRDHQLNLGFQNPCEKGGLRRKIGVPHFVDPLWPHEVCSARALCFRLARQEKRKNRRRLVICERRGMQAVLLKARGRGGIRGEVI